MIRNDIVEYVFQCDNCDAELSTMSRDKCEAVAIAHEEGWVNTIAGEVQYHLCPTCGKDWRDAVESS